MRRAPRRGAVLSFTVLLPLLVAATLLAVGAAARAPPATLGSPSAAPYFPHATKAFRWLMLGEDPDDADADPLAAHDDALTWRERMALDRGVRERVAEFELRREPISPEALRRIHADATREARMLLLQRAEGLAAEVLRAEIEAAAAAAEEEAQLALDRDAAAGDEHVDDALLRGTRRRLMAQAPLPSDGAKMYQTRATRQGDPTLQRSMNCSNVGSFVLTNVTTTSCNGTRVDQITIDPIFINGNMIRNTTVLNVTVANCTSTTVARNVCYCPDDYYGSGCELKRPYYCWPALISPNSSLCEPLTSDPYDERLEALPVCHRLNTTVHPTLVNVTMKIYCQFTNVSGLGDPTKNTNFSYAIYFNEQNVSRRFASTEALSSSLVFNINSFYELGDRSFRTVTPLNNSMIASDSTVSFTIDLANLTTKFYSAKRIYADYHVMLGNNRRAWPLVFDSEDAPSMETYVRPGGVFPYWVIAVLAAGLIVIAGVTCTVVRSRKAEAKQKRENARLTNLFFQRKEAEDRAAVGAEPAAPAEAESVDDMPVVLPPLTAASSSNRAAGKPKTD